MASALAGSIPESRSAFSRSAPSLSASIGVGTSLSGSKNTGSLGPGSRPNLSMKAFRCSSSVVNPRRHWDDIPRKHRFLSPAPALGTAALLCRQEAVSAASSAWASTWSTERWRQSAAPYPRAVRHHGVPPYTGGPPVRRTLEAGV